MSGEFSSAVFEPEIDRALEDADIVQLVPEFETGTPWDAHDPPTLPSMSEVATEIPPFAGDFAAVARAAVGPDHGVADLLIAATRQARALALVLEAHRIGATTLPEPVLCALREASALLPALFRAPSEPLVTALSA